MQLPFLINAAKCKNPIVNVSKLMMAYSLDGLRWRIMKTNEVSLDNIKLIRTLCAGDEKREKPHSDPLPLHQLAGPWCAY